MMRYVVAVLGALILAWLMGCITDLIKWNRFLRCGHQIRVVHVTGDGARIWSCGTCHKEVYIRFPVDGGEQWR